MFKSEEIRLKFEAIKMMQGSLQQLMTLSAGGLALYFGFIANAPFIGAFRYVGLLAVLCWGMALCCAAVAHRLHTSLVVCLLNLSQAVVRVEDLESLPESAEKQAKKAIDPHKILNQALATLEEERNRFRVVSKAFELEYFPIQDRATRLVQWALCTFVLGFVSLVGGYAIWTFSA